MTVCGDRKQIKNTAQYKLDIYKSRNEKAIKYIKQHQRKDEFLNLNEWQTRDLLNILQGEEKE